MISVFITKDFYKMPDREAYLSNHYFSVYRGRRRWRRFTSQQDVDSYLAGFLEARARFYILGVAVRVSLDNVPLVNWLRTITGGRVWVRFKRRRRNYPRIVLQIRRYQDVVNLMLRIFPHVRKVQTILSYFSMNIIYEPGLPGNRFILSRSDLRTTAYLSGWLDSGGGIFGMVLEQFSDKYYDYSHVFVFVARFFDDFIGPGSVLHDLGLSFGGGNSFSTLLLPGQGYHVGLKTSPYKLGPKFRYVRETKKRFIFFQLEMRAYGHAEVVYMITTDPYFEHLNLPNLVNFSFGWWSASDHFGWRSFCYQIDTIPSMVSLFDYLDRFPLQGLPDYRRYMLFRRTLFYKLFYDFGFRTRDPVRFRLSQLASWAVGRKDYFREATKYLFIGDFFFTILLGFCVW